MSRFKFSCQIYGPQIVAALLADATTRQVFNQHPLFTQTSADSAFRKRLKTKTLIPEDAENYIKPLFKLFATQTDPYHSHQRSPWKYLDWICKIYLQAFDKGSPIKAEDLFLLKNDLRDFKRLPPNSRRNIALYRDHYELHSVGTTKKNTKKKEAPTA